MSIISLTIDGKALLVAQGITILQAAQEAGIYIPTLCAHPDLPTDGTCGVCTVEAGPELVPACETKAEAGMVIRTSSDRIKNIRQDKLAAMLLHHPHACLTCAQKAGCSRTQCSSNVAVNERCCQRLGNCEIERLVEHIGLRADLSRYVFQDVPKFLQEPLFTRDYNLCIGCGRCLRACRDLRGIDALEAYTHQERKLVRAKAGTLVESGCKFCTACVEVCPTGALTDKDIKADDRANLVPCSKCCPAGIDVPRYVDYLAREKYTEALSVVREKVPFPATLGRVCFHPCEDVCRRGAVNQPIAICRLKRFAADQGSSGWKSRRKLLPLTNKKVAVVGSGPAGLTAANYLALKGHTVTVFESQPQAGGMLRLGIPNYRLPEAVLNQEIADIEEVGVEIKTNSPVASLDKLFENGYHAVFVAVGAHQGLGLGIPGEDSSGVLEGVTFLRTIGLRQNSKIGRRVAVVGGGSVAVDAARTAYRLGAEVVTVLYRRTREEMPASGDEAAEAVHEGIKFEFLTLPGKITATDHGLQVVCQRMELGEPEIVGRSRLVPVEGDQFTLDCDNLIVAVGQRPIIPEGFGLVFNGSAIQVNQATLATNKLGVYAGGDAVLGPASVIEAIAHGRKAASSIDVFLGGSGDISEILVDYEAPNPWLGRDEDFASAKRVGLSWRPWQKSSQKSCGSSCSEERLTTAFVELDLGLLDEMAKDEAARCLNCQLRLQIQEVPRPPDKWQAFNPETVAQVPETEGVFQLLDANKKVIYIIGTMNLSRALKEHLENEEACYFGYEQHSMFTQRESQLLQQFLQEHGKLPKGNDELDDLF